MSEALSQRERLLRAVRWEPGDRVPLLPPIPYHPLQWEDHPPQGGWQTEDNFLQVLELVRRHCALLSGARHVGGLFDRRFFLVPREYIEVVSRETLDGHTTVTTVVHTPQGDLRTVDEHDAGVATGWYTEPLLKSEEDVEKLLSVPYHFEPPDLTKVHEDERRLGDRGLQQIGVSTPLVSISRMFHFDQFLEWCASKPSIILHLMDVLTERIRERLEYCLAQDAGPVYWFGGSEQATPPMMSPEYYDTFVVPYDGPLMQMVREAGKLVHVHCHGKVNQCFEKIMDMGAHMLDPLEPPPDGDLPLAEAKARARGRMALIGNIEFRHLEFATPQQIEDLVRRALCEGPKEGLILGCSATAIATVTDRYRDNAIRYIEAGLEYGTME